MGHAGTRWLTRAVLLLSGITSPGLSRFRSTTISECRFRWLQAHAYGRVRGQDDLVEQPRFRTTESADGAAPVPVSHLRGQVLFLHRYCRAHQALDAVGDGLRRLPELLDRPVSCIALRDVVVAGVVHQPLREGAGQDGVALVHVDEDVSQPVEPGPGSRSLADLGVMVTNAPQVSLCARAGRRKRGGEFELLE